MRYDGAMSPHSDSRALLYIRVSTDKQAEHGHSLDAQRTKLLAYAARCSLRVVDVVIDGGESAGTLQRPGLQRALAMVSAGEVDLLVATKGDRVFRSVRDQLNVLEHIRAAGADFALADDGEDFDTTTPAGELLMTMRAAVAQYERKLAGQRTAEGMAAAKEKGVRLGRPPVAYTTIDGCLVPIEGDPRLAAARRAWSMVEGGASLASVAQVLQAEGVPTPTGRGRWYPATVSRLIRGPREESCLQPSARALAADID